MPANPTQFAVAVLKGIGAPVTSRNIAGFIGWSKAEGPLGSSSWQRNNPLNTTEPQGAVGGSFNSAGVRAYPTPQAGVAATVKTLKNGYYPGIVGAFKSNNPLSMPVAQLNTWGTGANALATIRDTLGQHFNVPSGQSSLGAPSARPGSTTFRTPGRTISTTQQVFDKGSFDAARVANIAGNYLASAQDPYKALEAKTGLSTANPLLSSGVLTTGDSPNPSDYMKAQTVLQRIAGQKVTLNQHPVAFHGNLKGSGYTNPLPGASWERTDMGVDASMGNGAPIRAIGDSRVVHIYPNWYAGQPYVLFQLLNGPQAGKYYYIAEAINPRVKQGDRVRAGQTVGTFNSGGTGLEIGWGTSGSQTLAQATGRDNASVGDHANTPAGINFRNFLNGIGAHAG